jgi:hypothetical protein
LAAGVYSAEIRVSTDDPEGAYVDAIASYREVVLAKFPLRDLIGNVSDGTRKTIRFT